MFHLSCANLYRPPPLQTRRAKRLVEAQAQAVAPSAPELPTNTVTPVETPTMPVAAVAPVPSASSQRPKPRPIPEGLELSTDSDDGFMLPKHRAKFQRALARLAAKIPDTILKTILAPTLSQTPAATQDSTVASAGEVAVQVPVLAAARPRSIQTRDENQRKGHLPERLPPSQNSGTHIPVRPTPNAASNPPVATSTGAAVAAPKQPPPTPMDPPSVQAPCKPIGTMSPGGRHYSGLFPSRSSTSATKSVTSVGAFPPVGRQYSSRVDTQHGHAATGPNLGLINQEAVRPQDNDLASTEGSDPIEAPDNDDGVMELPSPNTREQAIRRICIRNGLDPVEDFEEVRLAYEAARREREAEWDGVDDPDMEPSDDGDGSDNDGGDGDSSSSSDDGGENESNASGRYDDEPDAWLIDPDTDNMEAPCAYDFHTSQCSARYYGPAPEWTGQSRDVERFTKFRFNDNEEFRPIPGGYVVPRFSVHQCGDARREADRLHQDLVAQGKAVWDDDDQP